jgi:hypothetical protein
MLVALSAMVSSDAGFAQSKPAKIAITADSPDALLILKTEHVPIPYPYQSGFMFNINGYDVADQSLAPGGTTFGSKEKNYFDGYLFRTIKPGTYVFKDFSRQDRWALCFNDNSFYFTVKAGQALYLGQLDSVSHVRDLETSAITSGRVTSRNSEAVHFFDNIAAPRISVINQDALSNLAKTMKALMPKTTVQPEAAIYQPARFGTGRDLFGLHKVCGGYYSGKAKPQTNK